MIWAEDKPTGRTLARRAISQLSPEEKSRDQRAIITEVQGLIEQLNPGLIFYYWPLSDEVDLHTIMAKEAQSRTVLLPLPHRGSRSIDWLPWDGHTNLSFAELIPDNHRGWSYSKAQTQGSLGLIPGLAYDPMGYRLGRGGGYYDNFLAHFSGTSLGIAFRCCLGAYFPREVHDIPTDKVAGWTIERESEYHGKD